MPEGTIDAMMRDYAEAAVDLARDFGVRLDYSEHSLEELERILAQLHQERRAMLGSGATKSGLSEAPAAEETGQDETGQGKMGQGEMGQAEFGKGETQAKTGQAPSVQRDSEGVEEQMVMMCKLWGGYLGEVVRRRWGGEWAMETYPGAGFATLTLNVRGAKLFPSMKIYRRLTEGDGEDVWSFYKRVKEKLG